MAMMTQQNKKPNVSGNVAPVAAPAKVDGAPVSADVTKYANSFSVDAKQRHTGAIKYSSEIPKTNVVDNFKALGEGIRQSAGNLELEGTKTDTLELVSVLGSLKTKTREVIGNVERTGMGTVGYRFVSKEPIDVKITSADGTTSVKKVAAGEVFDLTVGDATSLLSREEYGGMCVQPYTAKDAEGKEQTYLRTVGLALSKSSTAISPNLRIIATNQPAGADGKVPLGSLKENSSIAIDAKDPQTGRFYCLPDFQDLFGFLYVRSITTARSTSAKKAVIGESARRIAAAVRDIEARANM